MKRIVSLMLILSVMTGVLFTSSQSMASTKNVVNITKQKYSYKECKRDIKKLCSKYSDYASYSVIGKSVKGRNIYDVVIGNPNAEKSLLVVCCMHAREYITSVVAMRQIEYYLKNYNKKLKGSMPRKVFDKVNVHYIVMDNPDGVAISQGKNMYWKANGRGVDLNRNWAYNWSKCEKGSKRDGTSRGSKAMSEPETKALYKLIKSLKKNSKRLAVVNYHSMGRIIFGDTYCIKGKGKSYTEQMYSVAKQLTGYSSAAGYPGTGYANFREYVMKKHNVPCITIELGKYTCPGPFSEYSDAFKENKYVVLKEAEIFK